MRLDKHSNTSSCNYFLAELSSTDANSLDREIGESIPPDSIIPTLISVSNTHQNLLSQHNDIENDDDIIEANRVEDKVDYFVDHVVSSSRDLKDAFKDVLDPPTISISSPSTPSSTSSSSSPGSSPEMRRKDDIAHSNGKYLNESKDFEDDEDDDRSASNSWDEDEASGQFQNHRDSLRLGTPRPDRASFDAEELAQVEEEDGPELADECKVQVESHVSKISKEESSRVEAEFEKRTATLNIFDEIDLNQK